MQCPCCGESVTQKAFTDNARAALLVSAALEVLKPFAAKAEAVDSRPRRGPYGPRDSLQISHRLGDFRAAARLLQLAKEPT